jgi:hypothetical protein
VIHRIVPRGNLATLNKTDSPGNRSKTRKVGVIVKARELKRGACRPGSSTGKFSLTLHMEDDDGDEIKIVPNTLENLTCDRRIRRQKFSATYEVENCASSPTTKRRSKGNVTVTASTSYGQELEVSRTLKCKK